MKQLVLLSLIVFFLCNFAIRPRQLLPTASRALSARSRVLPTPSRERRTLLGRARSRRFPTHPRWLGEGQQDRRHLYRPREPRLDDSPAPAED